MTSLTTGRSALAALVLGAGLLAGALVTRAPAAEAPGDAARGRALFEEKRCARCHVPRGEAQGMGPALEAVRRPQGALQLAGRLWNHAPVMSAALEKEGLKWPELTRPEMADVMAYLQADPSRDPAPDLSQGQVILLRKGCLKCHRFRGDGGSAAMEFTAQPGRYESPVAWATTIWNHSPRMAGHLTRAGLLYPRFSGDEMAHLFEFLRSATAAALR